MQKLDPDTREVIHLRLAGEFSLRDIGDILGKSEVWARVRFYRGKEELAKRMGGKDNGEHKLDCCVVRDLLPAYIEELTETETSVQVADHLENRPACRDVERDMRTQVPVEKAPKGALNFLKRVKRTRLLAAALSVILTLWCMWWLYDQEFHWKDDNASLTLALEEHVGWTDELEKAEFRVQGVLEDQRELTVAFAAPMGADLPVYGSRLPGDIRLLRNWGEERSCGRRP